MPRDTRVRWLLVAVTVIMAVSSGPEVLDSSASLGWRILNLGFIVGMLANTVWMWRRPREPR
jgi:hypothetical protein